MANVPVIKIDGKEIFPPKPKMSLWREIIKLKDIASEINVEFLDTIANIIVKTFQNPLVTVESIEDSLDLDEYMALFTQITVWVESVATDRVSQVPNGATPRG